MTERADHFTKGHGIPGPGTYEAEQQEGRTAQYVFKSALHRLAGIQPQCSAPDLGKYKLDTNYIEKKSHLSSNKTGVTSQFTLPLNERRV